MLISGTATSTGSQLERLEVIGRIKYTAVGVQLIGFSPTFSYVYLGN